MSTHEAAEALGQKDSPHIVLLVIDEAGQATELHALVSMVNLINSGGALVLVGDPNQLPPT
eukprot:4398492-Pyramimonas_sp.AAC.1